jgi:hypothetical protein
VNSGGADSSIVKGLFAGCQSCVLILLKKLGFLGSAEYLEFKLSMFQLVGLQKLALMTGVGIVAGQPAVGR